MQRQLRGQGVALTAEEVAVQRARVRMAVALRGTIGDFMVVWSPEETQALRAALEGKGVRS